MTGAVAGRNEPVEFDPYSTTFFDSPYEMYRRLRDETPVYNSEKYGFWALSRYDDVVEAHKDWKTFSSGHGVELSSLLTDPATTSTYPILITMDPPEHDRMRSLVSRVFTPRAVQALEPLVREVITGLADDLAERDAFDAVQDFSGPFPAEIISRILGVPPEDRQQIRYWLDDILHREPGDLALTQAGRDAGLAAGMYFYDLVARKRRAPADDMLSRLTTVEVDRGDESSTRLGDAEIAGFAMLLGGAGAETVTKLVGNAFVLFARNPDQYAMVVSHPEQIPNAIEEILRYWPPSRYQGRYSTVDVNRHGRTIPAHRPVLRRHGTSGSSRTPTPSMSTDRPATRSGSGSGCTAASAPLWLGSRAVSLSRRWSGVGRNSASMRMGSAGCIWPTWPATRTCRYKPADRRAGVELP